MQKERPAAIFISYRRSDTGATSDNNVAENVFLRLQKAFGDEAVFMDTGQIQAGDRWEERILHGLKHAKVTLALIGTKFFQQENDKMRLEDQTDWVRRELEYSISKGKIVIPLLIDRSGALRDSDFEKVPPLKKLTSFQHYLVSSRELGKDLHQLIHRDLPGRGIPLLRTDTVLLQSINRRILKIASGLSFWQRLFFSFMKRHLKQELALKALSLYDAHEIRVFTDAFRAWLPLRYAPDRMDGTNFDFSTGMVKELMASDHQFFLLLGESGSGKSTGLAHLYTELAISQSRCKLVFLQIHLKDFWPVTDLKDKENTILLIDGMDEAAETRQDAERFFEQVENSTKDFAKVLISCRTQFFAFGQEERSQTATRPRLTYRKLYLQPLELDNVRAQVAKIYPVTKDPNRYYTALDIIKQSENLLARPLLLPYIQQMLENKNHFQFFDIGGNGGITAYEVYEIVIRKWVEREHERNTAFAGNYSLALMETSRRLALFFYARERQGKASSVYYADLKALPELQNLPLDELRLRSDSLLHRNNEGHYRFAHRTFKEYFYAVLLYEGLIAEPDFPFERYPDAGRFYRELCEVQYFRLQPKDGLRRHLPGRLNPAAGSYAPNIALNTFALLEKGISPEQPVYLIFRHFFLELSDEVLKALTDCAAFVMKNDTDAIPEDRMAAIAALYKLETADLRGLAFFEHRQTEKYWQFLHRSFPEFLCLREWLHGGGRKAAKAFDKLLLKSLRFPDLFADELDWPRFWQQEGNAMQLLLDNPDLSVAQWQEWQVQKGEAYTYADYMNNKACIARNDYEGYCTRLMKTETLRVMLEKKPPHRNTAIDKVPGSRWVKRLDLSHNAIQGSIDLRAFRRLEYLDVSGNPGLDLAHSRLSATLKHILCTDTDLRERLQKEQPPFVFSSNGNPAFTLGTGAFREPEMAAVQGGVFWMGSHDEEPEAYENEKPIHAVRLSGYSIGKYPVTVEEFARFVQETGYLTTAEREGSSFASVWQGDTLTDFLKIGCHWRHDVYGDPRGNDSARHPVIHVSWHDAVAYCEWLSGKTGLRYRLPTEAEWEYAALGGHKAALRDADRYVLRKYTYAGSDDLDTVAWHFDKFRGGPKKGFSTREVGSLKPNELGLYDMIGHVWECCADWYDPDYYAQCAAEGIAENPQGAADGSVRVLRGGSWSLVPRYCRMAYRYGNGPRSRYYDLGFRLVSVP